LVGFRGGFVIARPVRAADTYEETPPAISVPAPERRRRRLRR
jgi:hypothetical protein